MKICFKVMWYGLFVLCKFSLKWLPSHSPVGFRWMSELFPLWLFFPTGFLYFEIILRSQKRKKFCELWNFHNTGWGNAPHKGYNLTILDYNQPQTTCSMNAFTLVHLADEISSAWCFWWSKGSGWKYQLPTSFKLQMQKWVKDGIVSWQKLVRLSFFPPRLLPYT